MKKELKESVVFLVTTIFLSYLIFWGPLAVFKIPTVNLVKGEVGPIWAIVLFIVGGFVPSVTGIILTAFFEGKNGVKKLLRNSGQVKIGMRWIITMILISFYLSLSLIFIYSLLGGDFDYAQFFVQLPTILPLIFLGPLSEEYGWRGFALKRLLIYLNPNLASLIVGIVWALWHLPLFYMLGTSQYEFQMPFIAFLISVTSISFIYTFIYIKTNQSVFSAIFFHWIYTYVIQVVSSTVERSVLYNWLEAIPTLLVGIIFMGMLKRKKLDSNNSQELRI